MTQQINIKQLITTSTKETFKQNLKDAVEKNVPIGERLTLYNYIATDVYSKGYRDYAVDGWELGVEYLGIDEIEPILKADFCKTYGLACMELNQFDLSREYLYMALDFLGDTEDNELLIDIYFGLSIVYKYLTNIPKAIEFSQKAIDISKKMRDDFEISRAYLNSANLFAIDNKNSRAKEEYLKALEYAKHDEVRSNIFMSLGLVYKNEHEYDNALEMYEKAEDIFFELEMVNEIFELYINYGTLYSKLARFDEAKEYLQKASEYFEQIDDSYNSTTCYLNLGRVEQDRANFSEALLYFDKAIDNIDKDNNLISLASLLYYSRANIYTSLKEYTFALKDYEVALLYAKEQNDKAMVASIKNALAGVEVDRGELESAERIYKEIIEQFEVDDNIEEIIATYTNIALLYNRQGLYQLAQKAHKKALELLTNRDMPQLKISILINLAEVYASVMDISKSISIYNEVLELLSLYDNDDLLAKCYLNLANIYESISEFEKAIEYAKLALKLKERLKQNQTLYMVYNSLACSYDGLKQVEDADRYYKEALSEVEGINDAHYYGILVNYGLYLFKLKDDYLGALECYDDAQIYFEKRQEYETLIAIYSNYAMLYQARDKYHRAINYYKKALEYADIFLSFIEDEELMIKYRINFEHIYENLIQLYLNLGEYKDAFYYLEGLKSRTFSKILSADYFESTKIPDMLLKREKEAKKRLEDILSRDSKIVSLGSKVKELYQMLDEIYLDMHSFDTRYVLIKRNTPLKVDVIKGFL